MLKLCFKYSLNLHNKCNTYTCINVTYHVPHLLYSQRKKMFTSTIFVSFQFIIVHIRNPEIRSLSINVLNALNLAQYEYDITKSNKD